MMVGRPAAAAALAVVLLAGGCAPPDGAGPDGADPIRPDTPIVVETHEGGRYSTAPEQGGWVETVREGHLEVVTLHDAAGEPAATIVPLQARIDVDVDGRPTGVNGPPADLHAWVDRAIVAAGGEITDRADGHVTVVTDRPLVPGGVPGLPSGEAVWQLQQLHDGTVLAVIHRPGWPVPPVVPHLDD